MSRKINFELRPFAADSLKKTRSRWEKQLKNADSLAVMPSEYSRLMDWAEGHMDYVNGEEFAYGIFPIDNDVAVAVAEIIYTRRQRRWLKLLNLTLSPQYDVSLSSENPKLSDLMQIFAAAVVGTVHLTAIHASTVTKLYGRSSGMLSFLKGFAGYLEVQKVDGITATIEGRWLVFTVKRGK